MNIIETKNLNKTYRRLMKPEGIRGSIKRQYAVVMGQKSQLFMELTANDTLRLFKEIYEKIPCESGVWMRNRIVVYMFHELPMEKWYQTL